MSKDVKNVEKELPKKGKDDSKKVAKEPSQNKKEQPQKALKNKEESKKEKVEEILEAVVPAVPSTSKANVSEEKSPEVTTTPPPRRRGRHASTPKVTVPIPSNEPPAPVESELPEKEKEEKKDLPTKKAGKEILTN